MEQVFVHLEPEEVLLHFEDEPLDQPPRSTRSSESDQKRKHSTEPPLDVESYFSDYDNIIESKKEVVIVAKSGEKSAFLTFSQLQSFLEDYKSSFQLIPESQIHPVWIDVQYPTLETMTLIADCFGIHALTVEDCLAETEREQQKNELFDGYRFVSFSEYHVVPYTNFWNNVDVHIVVPEKIPVLVSTHNGPCSFVGSTLNRIQALRPATGLIPGENKKIIKTESSICSIPSPEWMLYVILDNIVDLFINLVTNCIFEVEQLDELVLVLAAREQTDLLRRIGEVRKKILILRMQLMRKQDILNSLILTSTPTLLQGLANQDMPAVLGGRVGSIKIFIRDILDHIGAMLADLEEGKDTLVNLTNAYLARVSIEMSLSANEQNQIMKKFSAMATIVLPLTFVTSLWGMNVQVPGQNVTGLWPFGTIAGSCAVVAIIATIIFWKIKWF